MYHLLPFLLAPTSASAAPTLSAGGTCPGAVAIAVSGATPSGDVAIVSSSGPGAVTVPPGPCSGTTLHLSSAGIALQAVLAADAAGALSVTPTLGAGACTASVQVLDLSTCAVSNVVQPSGGNGFWRSCGEILLDDPGAADGVYTLDPCATGAFDPFYCDMARGGWTMAGRQAASSDAYMGTQTLGTPGTGSWSSDLSCVPYSQIAVINETFDLVESQPLTPGTWSETGEEYQVSSGGLAFRTGAYESYVYGGNGTRMACVDYTSVSNPVNWSCDNDWVGGQRGHLADFAGEFCPGGRLDGTWAWSLGGTCTHRGVPYDWGFGLR